MYRLNANKNLFEKSRAMLDKKDMAVRSTYYNFKTEKTAYLSFGEEMLYTYLGLI